MDKGDGIAIMQTNLSKKVEKIFHRFDEVNSLAKAIIKYGSLAFLFIFTLGTALVVYNRVALNYDEYVEFIATSFIKSSFTILAESVIGGLLMDYFFNKN